MAFYGDNVNKAQNRRIGTADISHFRAPYKDWISLSAADVGTDPVFSGVVTGHLLYASPEMIGDMSLRPLSPRDASGDMKDTGDATLVEFVISPVSSVSDQNAVAVGNVFAAQGYGVLVSDTGLFVATKEPATIAKYAGAGQLNETRFVVLAAGPDIGLRAEAVATAQSKKPVGQGTIIKRPIKFPANGLPSLASMTKSFLTGPAGVAVLVLGAAGLAYMFWANKKKKRVS